MLWDMVSLHTRTNTHNHQLVNINTTRPKETTRNSAGAGKKKTHETKPSNTINQRAKELPPSVSCNRKHC